MSKTTIIPTYSKTPPPQVGGNYQQLIDSNPYRGLEYKKSPWQNFMSFLGFRTQADAWQENMALNAAEYDAAIMQKKYDEQYNDPQSQLERMRAAGLNPDIDGGSSISSGQAVGLPEDPSTPMQTTGDEPQVMSVVNNVLGAFSTALGMVSSIQGVQGNHLRNVLSSITNEQQFADYAKGISGSLLPPSPSPDGVLNFDWQSAALNNAEKFANAHLPKSMRKKFIDFQEQYWNSAIGQGESYEDFRKRISARKGYAMDQSIYYTELGDQVLIEICEPLAKMAEKIFDQSQKTDLAQLNADEQSALAESAGAQTELAYQNELSGSKMAQAQNAANENAAASQGSMSIINDTIKDIISRLKVSSQKGGLEGALSSIAMALISGMYLYSQSGIHPSISRSEGSSSSDSYGKTTSHSGSHNRSLSIGF